MFTTFGLMLIIVIPVFIMTFFIVYRYREGGKGKYRPDFYHSRVLESVWWLIPTVLICVLSVITWRATHQLNPYKTIASNQPGLDIEVVALDWKWLFIYPNQNVASVNYLVLPVNHPVTFYITADAPMNSFWIPQLGGQIYAMAGMSTQLNLMATSPGNYYGSSANISGNGFAGMHFDTHAVSDNSFNAWVRQAASSKTTLSQQQYNVLDQPSINNPVSYYSNPGPSLYDSIIMKYMAPGAQMNSMMGAY
jgi:cytochrome o ubiquinol oxidase subunit 2